MPLAQQFSRLLVKRVGKPVGLPFSGAAGPSCPPVPPRALSGLLPGPSLSCQQPGGAHGRELASRFKLPLLMGPLAFLNGHTN